MIIQLLDLSKYVVKNKYERCDRLLNILEINDNFCDCLIRLFIFLGHIMNFIKILVPIIIIVMGSIDFIKAVIAQKEDEMKKSQSIFIKRLIYGVATFFVISIIAFLIGLAGGDTNNRCFKCVANVNSKECDKDNIPVCKTESQTNETPNEVPPATTPNPTPETPTVDPETPIVEEPNVDGWDCSSGSVPVEGCRVHFSDLYIGSVQEFFTLESSLGDYNDILGKGNYSNSHDILLHSYAQKHTLDSILIDKNTKLIYYKNKNFEGDYYEKEGPLLIYTYGMLPEQINSLETEFNGINYKYEFSNESFFGGYGGINLDSFKICCKN